MNFKPLVIGDLIAKVPLIQGGMGVGVSLSGLASAVAAQGGIGIISTAQIGYLDELFESNPLKANLDALSRHIQIAREKAKGGIIGVNIMTATRKYEEYVKESVRNGIDLIISGAGLPVHLPALVENSKTKIAPIISSLKAGKVLLKMWDKKHNTTADLIVIEGPKAGGHLGFHMDYLLSDHQNFDEEILEILAFKKEYEEKYHKSIPVVFAGGVTTQEDVKHYLDLGCDGVQVASRFVVTAECDVHENFKNAYINATEADITLVNSPVGMVGRALLNDFTKRTPSEREEITKCYRCLAHCDPATTPYCITKALVDAAKGEANNALVFCGADAYKINKRTTVEEVIKDLFY